MKDWVSSQEFERLGVFPYSHEEDTSAYELEDNVPQEVKQEKAEEIMALQSEISLRKNQRLVGQKLKVLIDRVEGEYFVARTEFDSPDVDNEVLIKKSDHYMRIGDFQMVLIESADFYDLYASPIA